MKDERDCIILCRKITSAPIGERDEKLEIMTDRQSDRQTDIRAHREDSLLIILYKYVVFLSFILKCLLIVYIYVQEWGPLLTI